MSTTQSLDQYLSRPDVQRKSSKFFLFAFDLLLLSFAYMIAAYLRFKDIHFDHLFAKHFYLVALSTISSLYIFELYSRLPQLKPAQLLTKVIAAMAFSFIGISLILYILGADFFEGNFVGRGILAASLLSFSFFTFFVRLILGRWLLKVQGGQKYLFIGPDEETAKMMEALGENSYAQIQSLSLQDLTTVEQALTKKWSMIVVGESAVKKLELKQRLVNLRLSGKNLLLPFEFYEKHLQKIPVQLIDQEWILRYGGFSLLSNPIGLRMKRLLDLFSAALLLIITLPVFLFLPVVMKLLEKGPLFYTQIRVGHHGRHFKIIKFRTMVVNAEAQGAQWAQSSDPRITRLGNFLRKTRIDELPQLFCVLKGDMSLIGPRPERPEFTQELARAIPFYDLRHLVKPGVTGWAQVMYPYGASVEDAIRKLEFDLYYVKNYSLLLDLMITMKTIKTVVGKAGR